MINTPALNRVASALRPRTKSILSLSLAALALSGVSLQAQVTAGYDFYVNAGDDTDGDQYWEDQAAGNPSGYGLLIDDSPAVTRVVVSGSNTAFTHAYDLPGGSTGNEAGLLLVDTDTTTVRSFTEVSGGGWDVDDVTLEIWFKPDSIDHLPSNGQILFEDGGGTGMGLLLNDDVLYVTHDGGSPQITYNLTTDTLGVMTTGITSDFIQAVVTHSTTTPFLTELYINGVKVGETNDDNDWSGGDDAAFGTRGASNVGGLGSGQQNTESFDGQIAMIRMYNEQILTATEVENNFLAFSEDTTPPSISSTDPADNATDVFRGATLTASFSEAIALTGSGTVTLTDLTDGTDTRVINLPDAQVSVDGSDLVIAPTTVLEDATEYEVTIDALAIQDTAGTPNAYGGTASGEFTFTTAAVDPVPPVVTSYAPLDDATGLSAATTLVLTFDKNIAFTGSGTIDITDLGDGSSTVAIDLSNLPDSDANVSIVDNVLTIDPTGSFEFGESYAVQISNNAIANYSDVAYAGIADNTTWNFTIVSDLLVIHEPFDYPAGELNGAGGTTEVGLSGTWAAKNTATVESESLYSTVARSGGSIITTAGSNHWGGDRDVDPAALLGNGLLADGATLYFSVDLGYGVGGNVTNSRLCVVLGNEGMNQNNFKYYMDSPGATGLGVTLGRFSGQNGRVVATQVRDSSFGTSGFGGNLFGTEDASQFSSGEHGVIVGKLIWGAQPADDETVEIYRVDPNDPANEAAATLLSTLTVTGVNQQDYDTITWARGDLVVMDELRFGTTWASVTPPDVTAPLLATVSPVGAGDPPNGDDGLFRATFDEPVVAAATPTGNIVFRNAGDDTVHTTIAPDDVTQVTFSGKDVDIRPTLLPVAGNSYYIEIEPGALEDPAGNAYAGYTGSGTWDFTTDSTPPVVTITNNSVNGQMFFSAQTLTYTLSFDENITTSADVPDFSLVGTAAASIDSVTQTNPTTVEVVVTATGAGTITLNVLASASFADGVGNSLDGPFADAETITVLDSTQLNSALGVLDLDANGGVNPNTGELWQANDTYRLVFITSTETNTVDSTLAYYDAFVQARADASSLGIGGSTTWQAVISAEGTDARDHTTSNPNTDGLTTPIILIDGVEVIGSDYNDFWSARPVTNPLTRAIDLDENGVAVGAPNGGAGWGNWGGTWTGTNVDGTSSGNPIGSATPTVGLAYSGWAGNPSSSWMNRGTADSATNTYYVYAMSEVLTVTSAGGGGDPYDTWAGGPWSGTLTNTDPEADFDGGSLATGVEWVVGGDPTDASDDTASIPVSDNSDPDFFSFTFNRRDEANADGNTSIVVEYGNDLSGWTTAVHDGTDVIITENDDAVATGVDSVVVQLRRSVVAPTGDLFARLKVVVTTP